MEPKTKYRILGLLVIICLVIIVFPLLQTKNETPPQTALVKAPPFPDQTVQVSTAADEVTPYVPPAPVAQVTLPSATEPASTVPVQTPPIDNASNTNTSPNTTTPVASTAPIAESTSATELVPASTDTTNNQSAQAAQAAEEVVKLVSETETAPAQAIDDLVKQLATEKRVSKKVVAKKASHPVRLAKKTSSVKLRPQLALHAPINDNGLINLKEAVWVIQVGSYKNKATALRLVNRLRLKGYPAFIQHVFGENIRIFVGPAEKRRAAHQLAAELERQMHVHGIVVSYQPLTL